MNKNIILSVVTVIFGITLSILGFITWKDLALVLYISSGITWAYLYVFKPSWSVNVQLSFNALSAASFPKTWYKKLQIFLSPLWPIGLAIEAGCLIKPSWREKMYETD